MGLFSTLQELLNRPSTKLEDYISLDAPDFLTEDDDIEWIETGSYVVIHGDSDDYEGVVVATCPETQHAAVRFWHPIWKQEFTWTFGIERLELAKVETIA